MYPSTDQTDYDTYLPHATFAYNLATQATTRFSPFMLVAENLCFQQRQISWRQHQQVRLASIGTQRQRYEIKR